MEDFLLAILILAVFVIGYFLVDRFGKFLDENRRGDPEFYASFWKYCMAGIKGKIARIKAARSMKNSLRR